MTIPVDGPEGKIMNLDRLNQWLSLLANLGVLVELETIDYLFEAVRNHKQALAKANPSMGSG